jgi:hypothetical protein
VTSDGIAFKKNFVQIGQWFKSRGNGHTYNKGDILGLNPPFSLRNNTLAAYQQV